MLSLITLSRRGSCCSCALVGASPRSLLSNSSCNSAMTWGCCASRNSVQVRASLVVWLAAVARPVGDRHERVAVRLDRVLLKERQVQSAVLAMLFAVHGEELVGKPAPRSLSGSRTQEAGSMKEVGIGNQFRVDFRAEDE